MKNLMRRSSIVAVLISLLMVSLTGCSSTTTVEETKVSETVDIKEEVTEVETEVAEKETELTAEPTPEPTAEPTAEPTPQPIVYEGIDMESTLPGTEWMATFEGIITEPKIVICNDETNKKVIVENGEKAQLGNNDVLFVYTPNAEFFAEHTGGMVATEIILFGDYTQCKFDMTYFVAETSFEVRLLDEMNNSIYLDCKLTPEKE